MRMAFLVQIFCGLIDYFVSLALAQTELVNVGMATPFLVFGWKRAKYVIGLVVCLDDGPFKHRCMFSQAWFLMLCFNHILSVSMIGARTWNDVGTFVSCDWFQFGMRMVLLLRLGFKTCPRVISFLIAKQLENIACPLPKSSESLGDRTAMRIMQAYMCIIEGESLSVNFIFAFIFFLHNSTLMGYNSMLLIVPMRNVLMILLFTMLDAIQDVIASVGSLKFSNFSYLFQLGGGAWHSKLMSPFFVHIYVAWMSGIASHGGMLMLKKNSISMGTWILPTTTVWAHPGLHIMHM